VVVDPIFDDNHKFIGAVHIIKDITERKAIEHKVAKLNNELFLKNKTLINSNYELERINEELSKANEQVAKNNENYKSALLQANRFSEIIDNLPSYVYLKNSNHQYTYANQITLKLFNKTKENIYGSFDTEFFPHDTAELVWKIDQQILEKGECTRNEVEVKLDEDVSVFYLELKYPIYDEQGTIYGLCGISTDISELKNTEKALKAAKEKAEESDKLKSAFLANLSHEIRTPMNGILGFLKLLQKPQLTKEKQDEFISIINSSSKQLLAIINDIVEISKIETNQIRIIKTQVNVNNIIKEIYANLSLIIPLAKNIQLQTKIELPDEKCFVETDEIKLKQVLTNLVENALKYSESGIIELGYSIKDCIIEFYVSDQGIGIDEQNFDLIFNRFYKIENNLTTFRSGTGLGLSISKAYIEFLGGSIRVESKIGKGSTFFVSLPFQPELAHSMELNAFELQIPDYSNKVILIADDDPFILRYYKEILLETNINLIVAENGIQVVEYFKDSNKIDIVLMDLKMPKMTGYEALDIIRTLKKDVPVIAQTAFSLKEDIEKILHHGFDDYISKPILFDDLLQILQKYLKNDK